MPGTSSAKTRFALLPGHDEFRHRCQFYWLHLESYAPDEANHSAADAGVLDDRAEQLPALAVELHHLHLLVDAVIGRRRVGGRAGQSHAAREVLQAGRLLHDVFARQIVAALTQDMKTLADAIARKIPDEGGAVLQDNAGSRRDRSYASQSRVNAMAAGKAWTNRILWLTVTAP
jgi:hypothetical protein